ncbi:PREDICTED: pectinesterase-like isoform X2 [Nicotiana attenuata]|uniref:Pectinesterase n=2 Tax=Nicotiana attenuata TaxID=49451 RepID=A0A1J6ITZ2_NICAT|nr:PREDICTED: pectinesterase-like isoform X2 [Nicotiana attenuata]XP_019249228.1 PREDICTED: pectinesterase-like isoform X2 [Nicotiana attenuata]OIT08318.1 putative pectinesterasepectinesterase inhibitor 13 [Nicotiana attenuata]
MALITVMVATAFFLLLSWGEKGHAIQANVTVAKDGNGDFNTIMAAILAAPNYSTERYYIKANEGEYDEYVVIEKRKENIALIGDGIEKTIISGNKSHGDGFKTWDTATVLNAKGFMAQGLTIRNSAVPEKEQAVALKVNGDQCSFYQCRFEGYQDTLNTHFGHQFYRDCEIVGTIDFIFGDALAVFQNCNITVRKPLDKQYNTITAQGRTLETRPTGIVLQNCTIQAAPDLQQEERIVKTYMGRPWGNFSRTVVMQTFLGDLIDPKGWVQFDDQPLIRPFYLEFRNRGPGSTTSGRVKWAKVTDNSTIASTYTVRQFIQGQKWIPSSIPYFLGLL